MNWGDERWIKLYTRDTITWRLWRWQARTVFMHLLRKVDRAGVIDVDAHGVLGLAALLELPPEVVSTGMDQLLEPTPDGGPASVEWRGAQVVIVKFIEAQETNTTGPQRQRDYRERRRDFARRGVVDPPEADLMPFVTYPPGAGDKFLHDAEQNASSERHLSPAPPRVGTPRQDKTRRDKKERKPRADRAPAVEGYQAVIDCFDRQYRAAYAGSEPTWGKKAGAIVKRLIGAHGADEVQRRIGILFTSPPAWLKPPYDIGTLSSQFDKLVAPQRNGPLSAGRFEPPPGLDYTKAPWDD